MKTLIVILALICTVASAQVAVMFGVGSNRKSPHRKPQYHNHPLTPLLFEDFERTVGYDLPGWGENIGPGGIVNEDYTTTVLYGTQSLLVDEVHDDPTMTTNSFPASSRIWMAFRIRFTGVVDAAGATFLKLEDESGNCGFRLMLNTDNEILVRNLCANPTSANGGLLPVALNTTYTFWIEYWNDNGANSYLSLGFSEGSIRPTDINGGYLVEAFGNQSANNVSRIQLGHSASENGQEVDFIIDHILIDDVQIENYP